VARRGTYGSSSTCRSSQVGAHPLPAVLFPLTPVHRTCTFNSCNFPGSASAWPPSLRAPSLPADIQCYVSPILHQVRLSTSKTEAEQWVHASGGSGWIALQVRRRQQRRGAALHVAGKACGMPALRVDASSAHQSPVPAC
jgi:hypothetical protein